MIIAWDIETCPLPSEDHTPAQVRRFDLLLAREIGRARGRGEACGEEAMDDLACKVRSLHPALGWICCITVQAGNTPETPRTPKTYLARTPEEEPAMLRAFWSDLGKIRQRPQWVTFNGKRFDVEFLITRSLRWAIEPTRRDLLCRNIWRTQPHCDLATVWRGSAMTLNDVCELLGLESPKQHMDGGGVHAAVAAGDYEALRAYSRADVEATFACYASMQPVLV